MCCNSEVANRPPYNHAVPFCTDLCSLLHVTTWIHTKWGALTTELRQECCQFNLSKSIMLHCLPFWLYDWFTYAGKTAVSTMGSNHWLENLFHNADC